MYEAMFADGGESGKRSNAEGGLQHRGFGLEAAGPVAVFILNPSKRRVVEGSPNSEAPEGSPDFFDALSLEAEEGGFAYRYAYANSAGRSAAWLGGGASPSSTLSAGPCAAPRASARARVGNSHRGVGGAEARARVPPVRRFRRRGGVSAFEGGKKKERARGFDRGFVGGVGE